MKKRRLSLNTILCISALVDAIFGNGYQLVINAPAPSEMSSVKFANLFGSLYNTRRNVELDSLFFIAHYDAFSPSAQLSFESDASGTGVVALLSIASMMSRLYGSTETQPKLDSTSFGGDDHERISAV